MWPYTYREVEIEDMLVLMLIQIAMMAIPLLCDDLYVEFERLEDKLADAYSGWDLSIERPKIRGQMGHPSQVWSQMVEANSTGYEKCFLIQI